MSGFGSTPSVGENLPAVAGHMAGRRILIMFLLIRYAGAKLGEVLALNFLEDID